MFFENIFGNYTVTVHIICKVVHLLKKNFFVETVNYVH